MFILQRYSSNFRMNLFEICTIKMLLYFEKKKTFTILYSWQFIYACLYMECIILFNLLQQKKNKLHCIYIYIRVGEIVQ